MDIQLLKAQGLPVLEAQHRLHSIALDKALQVVSVDKSAKFTFWIADESLDIIPQEITFIYLEETLIPVEFITALECYANRLINELLVLDAAILDLREERQAQEILLSAFRNNQPANEKRF